MTSKEKYELLKELLTTNLLPLAFVGDSVHTQFVRENILKRTHDNKMDNYNSISAKYCKASSQAKVLQNLLPLLNEEEKEIVRRGRNAKPKHHAKNATTADYNYATAFEVLIGYLYLKGDEKRLEQILNISISD